ncbi:MAG: hypothetical protein ACPGJE_00235 [Wenzhouxiangellaceae bacterium]
MTKKLAAVGLTGLLFMTAASSVAPQENGNPGSVATDPAVAELELRKKIEQLRLDLITFEKEKLLAKLPETDTTGAEGTIEIDDKAGYYAEIVSYETLTDAATSIVAAARTKLGENRPAIILVDQSSLTKDEQLWRIIKRRLKQFKRRFAALEDEHGFIDSEDDLDIPSAQVAVELSAAATLLGGLADLAAFFKVDTEYRGRTFDLAESALTAETARTLLNYEFPVLIPDLSPVTSAQSLVNVLEDVQQDRNGAATTTRMIQRVLRAVERSLAEARRELSAREATLAKLKKATPIDQPAVDGVSEAIAESNATIEMLEGREKRAQEAIEEMQAAVAAFDAYSKAISESSDGKPSPLERVSVVDLIKANPDAYRLHMSIVSQGGEVQLTKSVWSSGRIAYLGGSVSTFFLFDSKGALLTAGTLPIWKGQSYKAKKGTEQLNVAAPGS